MYLDKAANMSSAEHQVEAYAFWRTIAPLVKEANATAAQALDYWLFPGARVPGHVIQVQGRGRQGGPLVKQATAGCSPVRRPPALVRLVSAPPRPPPGAPPRLRRRAAHHPTPPPRAPQASPTPRMWTSRPRARWAPPGPSTASPPRTWARCAAFYGPRGPRVNWAFFCGVFHPRRVQKGSLKIAASHRLGAPRAPTAICTHPAPAFH